MTAAPGDVIGPNGRLLVINSTAYTLNAGANNLTLSFTNASAITFTINPGLPVGFNCTVIQDGAGTITFTAASGVTINNLSSELTSGGQYARMSLNSVGQDIYVLAGEVTGGGGGGGITQLTGPVTAGPGSGSQATTIAAFAAPLVLTGQTSTPGSATGTLTNAPVAGNPTVWLEISINGTNYFIPGWT